MNEPSKALAAVEAIYGLLDPSSATLTKDFDPSTDEYVIRLEYRFAQPIETAVARADNAERQAQSVLRSCCRRPEHQTAA